MRIRQHLRKKASLESASTPVQNQLQTRSFGKGIQARQSGLPATNLLQMRPFGKGNQASSLGKMLVRSVTSNATQYWNKLE